MGGQAGPQTQKFQPGPLLQAHSIGARHEAAQAQESMLQGNCTSCHSPCCGCHNLSGGGTHAAAPHTVSTIFQYQVVTENLLICSIW